MHCRVRYLLNFDLKIRSGQVCEVYLVVRLSLCDKRIGKVSSLESIRRNDVILGKQIGTFSLSALNKHVRKKDDTSHQ